MIRNRETAIFKSEVPNLKGGPKNNVCYRFIILKTRFFIQIIFQLSLNTLSFLMLISPLPVEI